jgi:hypothetical protein
MFMFTHVERSMSWKLRAKKILADVAASVIGLVVLELSDQAHLKQLWRNHFRSNTCVLLR